MVSPTLLWSLNHGPDFAAAGVFTTNRIKAAPVLWSQQALADGRLRAVILNSGGANACTGPDGFADTHRTAELVAQSLPDVGAVDVAVCSTGLIGQRLPMDKVVAGISDLVPMLSPDGAGSAAEAIMTTDSVPKQASYADEGWSVGGMAKGAGMLAPGLATMLVLLTTDAVVDPSRLHDQLAEACRTTFDRVDSDGCMSTNDTVILMSSGASGVRPDRGGLPGSADRDLPRPRAPAAARRRRIGPRHHHLGAACRLRGRRRGGGPRDRPQQPVQVRDLRSRPQLGPGPGCDRHHGRRLRAGPGRRCLQRDPGVSRRSDRGSARAGRPEPPARSRSR